MNNANLSNQICFYISHASISSIFLCLNSLSFLLRHLVSPQPVLVKTSKTVHHNWDGKSQSENTKESTKSSKYFAKESLQDDDCILLKLQKEVYRRVAIIANCGNGHHAPPKAVQESPSIIMRNLDGLVSPLDSHSWSHLRLADVHKAGKGQDTNTWK